jgi:hypothetical protein
MKELDLKRIPLLKNLPVFDASSREARDILNRPASELAEACDSIRVHDILHRSEYKPLAAVREDGQVRVYFEILDHASVG